MVLVHWCPNLAMLTSLLKEVCQRWQTAAIVAPISAAHVQHVCEAVFAALHGGLYGYMCSPDNEGLDTRTLHMLLLKLICCGCLRTPLGTICNNSNLPNSECNV